jgi:two-component system cell cycle sensor histidine kinase/response regulator CckA
MVHKWHQTGRSEGDAAPVRPLRVLLLEPSPEDAERVVEVLRTSGLEAETERRDSLGALEGSLANEWDVLVTTDNLADGTLQDVLAAARARDADLPVVAVSTASGDHPAVEALRAGAHDFIDKAELGRLAPAVRRAVEDANVRRERRDASDLLATSEMRFRAAIDGGFDAFFIFDYELDPVRGALGFRLVDMNSQGEAIFGSPREELIGKFFLDFENVIPERVAYFSDRFREVYERGTPFEEEYKVQSETIEARWLHYQVVPLLSGVAVTARDVTQRRLHDHELQESERRFLNVVQHVPGVFFTLVPAGGTGSDRLRFDFLSDGIESITGYTSEEFAGPDRVKFVDLLHPDDRIALAGSDDLLLSGRGCAVDVRIVRADGETRWVHVKSEPNFDADGKVRSGSGVMLDITERKNTEEALNLRQRAIEAMTQGLVIVDATAEATPIVYVNPAFEELSGYSLAELVGRSPTVFDGPQTDPVTISAIDAALAARRPFNGEIFTYRKDGTPWWCSLRVAPVADENGVVTHFISIHTDETLHRQLEEQILQAQKMEAVARLAGGIAHDFNNVLLVIRGYSHVLMSMAGEEGEGWAEAKEIEVAANRASDLVRQLSAFTRNQVMQANVLDVNDVVRETQKLIEPLLGNGVELELALDTDAACVNVDPAQLEQAIVNLAMNACDAMPRGGTLLVSTHNVIVGEGAEAVAQLAPGAYTALSVEDTGSGMDSETRTRVFEPFFSTKGAAAATGLGLSAVYGMVKQSGGDVTVTSAPGEGTAVTIYLPHAIEAGAVVAHRAEPTPCSEPGETVLLVEDDHKARALVGRVLRESGYSVHEAALPDEALRVCDEFEGRIHLLLSDVVMPQMSGPKLAKLVLERRPDTRVMFVSGYIERPDDVDDVTTAADFLQKPFTPAQLIETVRRVLDNEVVEA